MTVEEESLDFGDGRASYTLNHPVSMCVLYLFNLLAQHSSSQPSDSDTASYYGRIALSFVLVTAMKDLQLPCFALAHRFGAF